MRILREGIFAAALAISCLAAQAQINTDQVMRIGQNALYFEDYMLSIQYFNQVITAKPYLAQPYFFRAIAKLNLDDFRGAEEDASLAIERNPFIYDAYEVRGVARQNLGKVDEAIEDYNQVLEALPENKQILFNKALAEEEIKDYDSAEKSFEQLLSAHPGYDNGYMGRAKLRLSQGDTIQALADINKTLELNKNATNAYVMRADIAIKSSKDYEQALADMDEAIKLEPRYAGFFINRAYLRYNLDDYFGAMSDYDYAIQLDPINTVALFNRGLLRSEVHDNDRAIEDFSSVLRIDNNDYRALYNRALLYRDVRAYKEALADIDRVIEAYPDFAGAYFLRFDIYREQGNMKKAEQDYNKSLALAKKSVPQESSDANGEEDSPEKEESQEIVANRFTTLLTIENDTDVKEEFNNKNIRGKVQDRDVNIEAEPMFALSYYSSPTELQQNTYYLKEADDINATRILRFMVMVTNHEPQLTDESEIKRHFESIEYYDSYIATHPPRAIDYFGRAMDHVTIHNYKAAIEDLDKALELTSDFTLAYFLRGIAKYKNIEMERIEQEEGELADANDPLAVQLASQRARKKYAEVIADFDKVIELSPRTAVAYYNKGNVLMELNDYTSALSAYGKALELKPDMGEAYYNRGYVYLKLGNKEAGLADLSKAGELGILPSYNLLKRMAR